MRPKSALDLTTAAHTMAGRTLHVGVLVPWANTVVEAELPQLRPDDVVFHYARLVPPDQSTVLDEGFLDGLRAAVPSALASMSRLPLETVLLACTSAGFPPSRARMAWSAPSTRSPRRCAAWASTGSRWPPPTRRR